MPKVYEQQITAQAAGGSRVKYDKIQDYITPALDNANKATQNAMDAMRKIGDSRAASELEKAARDAASEIENWSDFSKPEKTIDDMMSAGMKKYDDVMSKLDSSTRNRISMYNPKSREIFELKVQEQANRAAFDYSYKNSMANLDLDVGNLITESDPEDPMSVIASMKTFLERAKKTMRPADYLAYEKAVKSTTEEGLVEWYIAHGDLLAAYNSAINDSITGDVSETTRARWVKSIENMMDSASKSSNATWNKMNYLDVHTANGGSIEKGLLTMSMLSEYAVSGTALPADLQKKYGDEVLAGGKTYNELMQMPRSQRVAIIEDNNKAVAKGVQEQALVRRSFLSLQDEFINITDDPGTSGEPRKLKEKADISRLKDLYREYNEKGFGQLLMVLPNNSDMTSSYLQIMDIVGGEQEVQVLALNEAGINMSFAYGDPSVAKLFDFSLPSTKEQAKLFNTPEYEQRMSLIKEGNKVVDALNAMPYDSMGLAELPEEMSLAPVEAYIDPDEIMKLGTLDAQTRYLNESVSVEEFVATVAPEKINNKTIASLKNAPSGHTRAEKIQSMLDKALEQGQMTKQRHAELSRYIYDLSEGNATRTFPCFFPNEKMPLSVWNQCLASHGLGEIKNVVTYDAKLDEGWHNMSAPLRRSTITKYKSGEVGDVAQLMTSFIQNAVMMPGNSEEFGIPSAYASAVTPGVMADVYNEVEAYYAKTGEIHNLVDLTNNSDIYARKGGEVDGKTWNPLNPSPETTFDLSKSKQYEMLGAFEAALSKRLGSDIKFTDRMKMHIAENIRRVSKGSKGSIKGISEKELKEQTDKNVQRFVDTHANTKK